MNVDLYDPDDIDQQAGTEPWKEPVVIMLERVIEAMDAHEMVDDCQEVVPVTASSATVGVWIDGHEYSLTLNREN